MQPLTCNSRETYVSWHGISIFMFYDDCSDGFAVLCSFLNNQLKLYLSAKRCSFREGVGFVCGVWLVSVLKDGSYLASLAAGQQLTFLKY